MWRFEPVYLISKSNPGFWRKINEKDELVNISTKVVELKKIRNDKGKSSMETEILKQSKETILLTSLKIFLKY
jgi:hypothetical protein